MPPIKKLPADDVLMRHFTDGMSDKDISLLYGTTVEAVRKNRIRLGFIREPVRPNHGHYLPWRVRADHTGDFLARRLRAYSKRQQGRALSATEERLLDDFITYMEGGNQWGLPLSVHYNMEDGFWLEARKPGDRDFISPPQGGEAVRKDSK